MNVQRRHLLRILPLFALLWISPQIWAFARIGNSPQEKLADKRLNQIWGDIGRQKIFPTATSIVAKLREDGYLVRSGDCRAALDQLKAPVEAWVDPSSGGHFLILHAAAASSYNLRLLGQSGTGTNASIMVEHCNASDPPLTVPAQSRTPVGR